jgi:hypothetical protein
LTAQAMRFDGQPAALPCAVCGREAGDGLGWFLVAENSWFDRVKVLRWHPALAEQAEMRGVCCKPHLKQLLAHWLTCANLHIAADAAFRLPVACNDGMALSGSATFPTSLVGELAVYRDSLSRAWSGSPQALESILAALLDGLGEEVSQWIQTGTTCEPPSLVLTDVLPDPSLEGLRLYAFQS